MEKVIDFSGDLDKLTLAQLISLRDMSRSHRLCLQKEVQDCIEYEQKIRLAIAQEEYFKKN